MKNILKEKIELLTEETNFHVVPYVFLILSIGFGIFFRIKGLGRWPLAIDEYYIVKSVQNILLHGLPEFPNGGYYERGILYQYLTAGLFLIGIKVEIAVRVLPVLSNIMTIIPLYFLVNKLLGKEFAIFLVFIYCFSVWEIEFARFGRMYSPFQFIFILYLFFFYKMLLEGDKKSIKWIWIISFISIFIYEASIFLAVINFLPLLWDNNNKTFVLFNFWHDKGNINKTIISGIILLFAILFLTIKFRFLGVNNSLPTDIVFDPNISSHSKIRIPLLLITHLFNYTIWLFLFLVPLAFNIFTIYVLSQNSRLENVSKYSLIFLVFLSLINLFGLLIFLLLCFLLINWLSIDKLKKIYKFPTIAVFLNFIFWSVFAVSTKSWHGYFPLANISNFAGSLKFIWKEFINYPYLYETFVLFRDTIPHLTFITIFILFGGIILFIKTNNHKYKLILFVFLFSILQISFLNLTYFKTRYFFFLHPIILILDFSTIFIFLNKFIFRRWLRTLLFIITSVFILYFSEDFNWNHVYNIDSEKINFRQEMNRAQKDHYYPRWDVRTPAELINKNVQKDDIVIVTEQLNEFYLNKQDYMYEDSRAIDFTGVSVLNGTRERWTNSKLIYSNRKFINLIKNSNSTIWVVINTIYGTRFMKEVSFFENYKTDKYYTSPDSSIVIYKIPPKRFIN